MTLERTVNHLRAVWGAQWFAPRLYVSMDCTVLKLTLSSVKLRYIPSERKTLLEPSVSCSRVALEDIVKQGAECP